LEDAQAVHVVMQIVLADDSAVTRRMLSATLDRAGHEVVAVADGEAAWAAFERHRPLMMVLDWQMPGLDGLDVCRRVRLAPGGTDVFVLMVTGRDATSHLSDALAAGVDDYLAKPATPEHLAARVRIAEGRIAQTMARRRAEEALANAQWLAGIGHTALALQHEITNPLMALLTHGLLLAEDPAATPGVREQVTTILAQARRIADVVRRLRELKDPKAVEYLGSSSMLDLSTRGTR
jgi:DNA-binding response OmpR family regulator